MFLDINQVSSDRYFYVDFFSLKKMKNLPENFKRVQFLFLFKQLYIARVGSGSGEKGPDLNGSATLEESMRRLGR